MRLGVVRGTVVLNQKLPTLAGLRLVILEPVTSDRLASPNPGGGKCLIAADQLNAGVGQMVGFSEGRTAASPWYPDDIPVDAYCCMIVENLNYTPPKAEVSQPEPQPAVAKPNGKKARQRVRQ
jgi:microcompartment protein CcmK/EutM